MRVRASSALLAVLAAALLVVVPTPGAEAARGNTKYEICHRTNSVSNPYRRIRVAWGALPAHQGHTGGVFATSYAPHVQKTEKWGDVFNAVKNAGQIRSSNWTTAGQALFAGSTFTHNGETRQACRTLSTIEFVTSEHTGGQPLRAIMVELDEQQAIEDVPLRTALGKTFTAWFDEDPTRTLEDVIAGLRAASPSATTSPATDVTSATATLRGTVDAKGATADLLFEYGTSSTLAGATTIVGSPASTTSTAAVTAAVTGLSPATTYHYRVVASVSSVSEGEAVDQDVAGAIRSFTTAGVNAPTVTTDTLADGQVGTPYSATLTATGGTTPYTGWTAAALPDGLTLAADTGVLSGTPTTAGDLSFDVSVAGANGSRSATKLLRLTVAAAPAAKTDRTLTLTVDHDVRHPGQTANLSAAAQPTVDASAVAYYVVAGGGACELSGATVTAAEPVVCGVGATVAEDDAHRAATASPVTVTFVDATDTAEATNVLTFPALPDRYVDEPDFTVSAGSTSGLEPAFSSQTSEVCTVAGATVTLHGAGVCTITATQSGGTTAGGTTVPAADPVSRSFLVSKRPNAITFEQPADRSLTDQPFAVSVSATSGAAVVVQTGSPAVCAVADGTVSLVAAGACTLHATEPGNSVFEAAEPVSRTFTVTAPDDPANDDTGSEPADPGQDGGQTPTNAPTDTPTNTPTDTPTSEPTDAPTTGPTTGPIDTGPSGPPTDPTPRDPRPVDPDTPNPPLEPTPPRPVRPDEEPPAVGPAPRTPRPVDPDTPAPPSDRTREPVSPRDPAPSAPRPADTARPAPRPTGPAPVAPQRTVAPPTAPSRPTASSSDDNPATIGAVGGVTAPVGESRRQYDRTPDLTRRSRPVTGDPATLRMPASGSTATATATADDAVDSVDLGGRGRTDGTSDAATAARRSLRGLVREVLRGFRAGSSAFVEVLGARTTGQFLLSSVDSIDAPAIAAAVRESTARTRTEFAWVDAVDVAGPDDAVDLPSGRRADEARTRAFTASQLPSPTTIDEVIVPAGSKWLRVTAGVATYQPGSTVYLAVTSQPIVFAQATVDRHGKAELAGAFPLDVVGAGGHRLRIVGTRTLGGVTADDEGRVRLARQTLTEIRRFDAGTHATVTIGGRNASGGTHTAIRIVPLTQRPPWWTLWIVAGVSLLLVALRRRHRLDSRRRRRLAFVAVAVSTSPALVLGWMAITYPVMAWGALLGVAGAAALRLVPAARPRDDEPTADDLDAPPSPELATATT